MRCFVMGLLVLALPVQGFAASTMLLCGAGHHSAAYATDGGNDHAGHPHGGVLDAVEAAASDVHHHAAPGAPAHGQSAGSPVSAKQAKVIGKCSACAACCTVAVLPTAAITFTAPAPGRAPVVAVLTTRFGFFTDGPDRPPRATLA